MTPEELTQAIISGINAGGEQFLEGTLAAALPIIWLAILGLHLGRPYILDMIDRFTLRLGADIWWMSYLLMRDALLLITFALSWIFFQPNLVANDAFPITGPISALLLLGAIAVKLSRPADTAIPPFPLPTPFILLVST